MTAASEQSSQTTYSSPIRCSEGAQLTSGLPAVLKPNDNVVAGYSRWHGADGWGLSSLPPPKQPLRQSLRLLWRHQQHGLVRDSRCKAAFKTRFKAYFRRVCGSTATACSDSTISDSERVKQVEAELNSRLNSSSLFLDDRVFFMICTSALQTVPSFPPAVLSLRKPPRT